MILKYNILEKACIYAIINQKQPCKYFYTSLLDFTFMSLEIVINISRNELFEIILCRFNNSAIFYNKCYAFK